MGITQMPDAEAKNYLDKNGIKIPLITTDQMREVDRLLIEEYHFDATQLVETAGKRLAELVKRYLKNSVERKHVLVAAGKGNNGGGGLAAARYLHDWGANVSIFIPSEPLREIPAQQKRKLEHEAIETWIGKDAYQYLIIGEGEIVIDAVLGYGLRGAPRGWPARIIETINAADLPVIALDLPSGLDGTTGQIFKPCVKATATLTLALPKTGLLYPNSKDVTGSLYLADLNVPAAVYQRMGLQTGPIFSSDPILPL
jgi:NAD(P)H-hydrate epimerase